MQCPDTCHLSAPHHQSSLIRGGGGMLSLQTPTHPKQMSTRNLAQRKSNFNQRSPIGLTQTPASITHYLLVNEACTPPRSVNSDATSRDISAVLVPSHTGHR